MIILAGLLLVPFILLAAAMRLEIYLFEQVYGEDSHDV